jgi:hypothetical protein
MTSTKARNLIEFSSRQRASNSIETRHGSGWQARQLLFALVQKKFKKVKKKLASLWNLH